VAEPHPPDREAGQRADEQCEDHHHHADKEAVPELVPETLKVPKALGEHDDEAVQGRMLRPDGAAEHVVVAVEGDHHHVVDR
jgi:hypothetical protein